MEEIYQCVACGAGPLAGAGPAWGCRECGARYPVVFGVPVFLEGVAWEDSGRPPGGEAARAICEVVGIDPCPANLDALRKVLARNYKLTSPELTAENNCFVNRVRAALATRGLSDPALAAEGRPPLPDRLAACPVNENVRYRIDGHYFPERLPRGARLMRNVRLTNTGQSVLSSRGRNAVHVSYHWRDENDRVLVWAGARTALLIDLHPGRSLTLPVRVRTPRREGPALLQLTLVQRNGLWMDDQARLLRLELGGHAGPGVPAGWAVHPRAFASYTEDHEAGRAMVLGALARRGHPDLRVLEVGGCCHPQMECSPYAVYNVDVDVQTLQVGRLRRPARPGQVRYVAALAERLPFADGVFDCVALFATLHHFADPVGVLGRLRRHLKEDGLLAVMCEPVGHPTAAHMDPDFLRELLQGINEQCYSVEEYALIFELAGLEAVEATVHGRSLKALLRPIAGAPAASRPEFLPARHGPTRCSAWDWFRAGLRRAV